jgi:RpiB/LacA/LacB family sugar-phosphate isomerase
MIVIGSDHGGRSLKEELKSYLVSLGYDVRDFSPDNNRAVDYPDIGLPAAREVSRGNVDRAILLCGTGLGMTILANKLPGIRACLCHDSYSARMSRAHNDSNVLVMGGRIIGPEPAKEIVRTFLDTPFEEGRHQRRLSKISDLEKSVHRGE